MPNGAEISCCEGRACVIPSHVRSNDKSRAVFLLLFFEGTFVIALQRGN